ncbi:MAG: aldo/keto reductase [Candidatus Bathyarchaeota archaeon]|nr:aldo/keto reductase [Candidatus Bathyarchaeota archaeon]
MIKRRLGRIGENVSIITLGGCGVGRISQEEADKAIKQALNHGVNMVDVAPTYGDAELRLAPLMKTHRDKIFLAEKTTERTMIGAKNELHQSLNRLGVKSFDLYQMHALSTMNDLDTVFHPEGAITAFKEAKETGLTKYLGITGHQDMRVLLEAIKRYDFDLILLPVSLCSAVAFHPMNDYRPVLEAAIDRDMGVTAIKAVCRGRWKDQRSHGTWYHPSDTPKDVELGVRFTLSQEPVTTYALPCDTGLWEMVLQAGDGFTPMDEDEQKEAVEYAKTQGFSPLFPE